MHVAQITRRMFTAGAAAAAVLPMAGSAQAAYPGNQTVKFIVGFTPGGAQDILGRVVSDRLGALWGSPTVVENVAGAGGNLAMDRVAKGPTDGSQVCILPPGIATNPFLYSKTPFDPEKDLIPLSQVATLGNLLCVRKDLPVNSVAELIDYAKKNPGKLNFASSGVGTTVHLSGELFKRMAGIEMVHVAYRGSAPALNDLLGGQVDLIFDNITSIIGHARSGNVKALGITTAKRSPLAPEFPAVADTVPGYETTSWSGVAVRAGTPKEICDKLEADTRKICQDPILKDKLATLIAEPVGSSAAEFQAFVQAERAKWGKLITDIKLKLE
jgi:tripartite-type tricarboxylate transporter receptor subunit TctC